MEKWKANIHKRRFLCANYLCVLITHNMHVVGHESHTHTHTRGYKQRVSGGICVWPWTARDFVAGSTRALMFFASAPPLPGVSPDCAFVQHLLELAAAQLCVLELGCTPLCAVLAVHFSLAGVSCAISCIRHPPLL
jgi:hypothetical protein